MKRNARDLSHFESGCYWSSGSVDACENFVDVLMCFTSFMARVTIAPVDSKTYYRALEYHL